MSEPEQRVGGVSGGHEKWTHREADAHGGGEGPCDELALVKLNQQGGLAHSAVPHQDGLQTDLQRNRQHHAGFSAAASTCRPRPCAVWAQAV